MSTFKQRMEYWKTSLNEKYQDVTNSSVIVEGQYPEPAYRVVSFLDEGDFGLIVAPPATKDLALTLAMATGHIKTDAQLGIKMPKLKSVIYIDGITNGDQLALNKQKIESFSRKPYNDNITTISKWEMYRLNRDDSDYGSVEESDCDDDYEFDDDSESEEDCASEEDYESEEDNDSETETETESESESENDDESDREKDDFDSVLTYLEEHDSYDGIFIRINSFINNFAKFPKNDFDRIIDWALSMKKQGKTTVLISDYILPHFDYLSREMDFVINFIPREDLTSTNRIYCSAQWLKHRKLNNWDHVKDGAAKSSSSTIHDHIIAAQTNSLNFDGNMPYFTMVRATANRDRATGWYVDSLK